MTLPPQPSLDWSIENFKMWMNYTLETYGKDCREAALEEAAKVCDELWDDRIGLETGIARDCAAAIRALKDTK